MMKEPGGRPLDDDDDRETRHSGTIATDFKHHLLSVAARINAGDEFENKN